MRALSTREYVLLGSLGLVALFLFYLRPDRGLGPAGRGGIGEDLDLGQAPVVRLHRLAGHTDPFDAQGRNLFQYYTPPPPPVKHVVAPPPPPPPRIEPQTPAAVVTRPPANSGPVPPVINLSYLGFLGPKEDKIAVFEDGQDLLLARRGEVVKQQFLIVDFGYETVVMGYVDPRFKNETQELQQRPGAAGGRSRGRR